MKLHESLLVAISQENYIPSKKWENREVHVETCDVRSALCP